MTLLVSGANIVGGVAVELVAQALGADQHVCARGRQPPNHTRRSTLPHGLFETGSASVCLITPDPQEKFEALVKAAGLRNHDVRR